ncbi:hypothetical protein ACHAPT_001341 [Fusarium lateritium]
MISKRVLHLCQAHETVSSVLAKDPSQAPGDVIKRLYGQEDARRHADASDTDDPEASANPLELALKCGRWGPTEPSTLFLQAFADALSCLDSDPMAGVVSPPLMGSHGSVPLTIVAPLQDIVRHCSNLIVRAEREVFLITCSWSPSAAQRLIKNALIELSKRAERRGQRVTVKVMYDKPSLGNIFNSHQRIKSRTFASHSIQLPAPEEVPFLDLEVTSLHRLVLGTLHAKFCIVDRRIAAIMSNNIEDNDNMEMMTHLEGPVVDSIYDTALITWNNPLLAQSPPHEASVAEDGSSIPNQDPERPEIPDRQQERYDGQIMSQVGTCPDLPEHTAEDPHYDDDIAGEIARIQSCYSNKPDETRLQATNRQLNMAVEHPIQPTGSDIQDEEEMTPYVETLTLEPVPIALVCRPPYGPIDSKSLHVPQNEAWLSLLRNARKDIFIQTPDLNAAPLMKALADALKPIMMSLVPRQGSCVLRANVLKLCTIQFTRSYFSKSVSMTRNYSSKVGTAGDASPKAQPAWLQNNGVAGPPHPLQNRPLKRLPTGTLLRNIILGKLFTVPLLMNTGVAAINLMAETKNPILDPDRNPILRRIMRFAIYDHFCSGITQQETIGGIAKIKAMGLTGVILNHAKEVTVDKDPMRGKGEVNAAVASKEDEDNVADWLDRNLKTIEMLGKDDFVGLKQVQP